MIYTLQNIRKLSLIDNPVKISYITDSRRRTKWKTFKLEQDVKILLSNNKNITIPKGFEWDLSSVPRIFSWILLPYGNFLIAALIHDWLYQNRIFVTENWFGGHSEKARKFSDDEMLKWSRSMQKTKKISFYNIDNNLRHKAVRWFGKKVWLD